LGELFELVFSWFFASGDVVNNTWRGRGRLLDDVPNAEELKLDKVQKLILKN
jgi:hypothetical protein